MPRYRVTLIKTLDWTVEVEANDPTEAVEIAVDSDEAQTVLCHNCARKANDGQWDSSEENVESIEETSNA